jgi:hypothetical protein
MSANSNSSQNWCSSLALCRFEHAFSFSKCSLVCRLGANADLKLERRAAHGGFEVVTKLSSEDFGKTQTLALTFSAFRIARLASMLNRISREFQPSRDYSVLASDQVNEEAILSLSLFVVPQALKQYGGQAAAITCR